jgi:uncharacterized protein with PQ loop repeat
MPRDVWVALFGFMSVAGALWILYGCCHGFVSWGRTDRGPTPKVYWKDDPKKFALGLTVALIFVIILASIAYFIHVHFPRDWRG